MIARYIDDRPGGKATRRPAQAAGAHTDVADQDHDIDRIPPRHDKTKQYDVRYDTNRTTEASITELKAS